MLPWVPVSSNEHLDWYGNGICCIDSYFHHYLSLEICAKDVREKESGTGSSKTGETGSKAVAKQEVPVSDNTQIIAVITAAIAAQMEAETGVCVPADGLVIRSIKNVRSIKEDIDMKSYTITVNGTVYDVTVEEKAGGAAAPAAPAQAAAPAPAPAQAPAPKAPAASGSAGSVEVTAPMPGKILAVKADVGQSVKKGDVILLLEAMKMENEVVAPQDGTIASINVNSGDMVEAGNVLATMD